MRDLWQALRSLPQLLLIQPEQLDYDLAFAVALVPPVTAGFLFFRRQSLLLFALCLLAGIVCLLSLQFARLTLGLPAWVGHKANHPLISSLLVASFLSPQVPPWVGVSLVALLVVLDTLLWPQLVRMMVHPALFVFAVLLLVEREFPVPFVNPFDLRPLEDPLSLWQRLHVVVDPIKLYVGNVPGPAAATSAGALLLGLAYLWYTHKISLGLVGGFLCGLTAAALANREDVAFQLSSGPTLFLVGFLAADRRRLAVSDRTAFLIGAAAGSLTMVLRAYGQGINATWESLIATGLLATLGLELVSAVRTGGRVRAPVPPAAWRTSLRSASAVPVSPVAMSRQLGSYAHEPALASSVAARRAGAPVMARMRSFESSLNPDDIVRRMRTQASRGPLGAPGALVRVLALLACNPYGLWLTWRSGSSGRTKLLVTAASIAWYPAVAAAGLLLLAPRGWLDHLLR